MKIPFRILLLALGSQLSALSLSAAAVPRSVDTLTLTTKLVLPTKADPGTPTPLELWLSTTTVGALKYRNAAGTSTHALQTVLYQSTTAVGNITTGVDDLISQAVAASTLGTNGSRLRFTAVVSLAANANSKQILAKWGATTCYDSTAQTANAGTVFIEVIVTRTGAATQNIEVRASSSNSSFADTANFTTATETLSGAVTFKLTGEAVATDDLIQRSLLVEFLPAP